MNAAASTIALREKPYLPLEPGWWKLPLCYMLTLSLFGLLLYPMAAVSLIFILYQWRRDRYNFLIMLTLFWGGFGFWPPELPTGYLPLAVSIALWFLMRKPPILKRTLIAIAVYIAFMFVIALLSVENIKIQVFMMSRYWMILYIIVPFAVFAGHKFEFDVFLRKLMPFALMIAIFYLLDAYVISGHILLPNDTGNNGSTIFSPAIHLLSGNIYRIYPPSIFFYALFFIPLLRTYRLRWWQWTVFIGSFVACQTFTIIIGFLVTYIVFQGKAKQILRWGAGSVVFLVGLYFVDGMLPTQIKGEVEQSQLRIKSSVDQFFDLFNAFDDEDIAEFGSGRMAQILPKLDIIEREGREFIGLGFLHPKKTTLNQYILENEYYSDIEAAEEVSAVVEISQVQVFIQMGWLGIIVVTGFYLYLYYIIRKLPHSYYYLSVCLLNFMWGFGGFGGIYSSDGCMTIAIAYAAIILSAREELPGFNCKWLKNRWGLFSPRR